MQSNLLGKALFADEKTDTLVTWQQLGAAGKGQSPQMRPGDEEGRVCKAESGHCTREAALGLRQVRCLHINCPALR